MVCTIPSNLGPGLKAVEIVGGLRSCHPGKQKDILFASFLFCGGYSETGARENRDFGTLVPVPCVRTDQRDRMNDRADHRDYPFARSERQVLPYARGKGLLYVSQNQRRLDQVVRVSFATSPKNQRVRKVS
mgnify:CR=1 FL=1